MPNVVLHLPYRLNGANLRVVVQSFVGECAGRLPDHVCLEFSRLAFIEPAGVTFLSNFILWLRNRGVGVSFSAYDARTEAIRFLDDSLFFEKHLGRKLNPAAKPRATTQPLIDVHHEESHAWLRIHMVPWLSDALGVAEEALDPFQVCVSEIFNNIKDHSALEIGSFFAQHFPRLDRVSIAVADFGRGIPTLVRKLHPDMSDNDAIRKAVEAGFTTSSTPRNQGIGLDYLLETVVMHNGGTATIYSLKGAVRFQRDGAAIAAQPLANVGFCPGTTIDISLRTDTIGNLVQEPEPEVWP